jgi:hypothetical protein
MPTQTTQDRIKVELDGLPDGLRDLKGPWATMSEEGTEWEITSGREESGGPNVLATGRRTRGNVTLTRKYIAERDAGLEDQVNAGALEGVDLTMVKTYLDGAYNPIPGRRSSKAGLRLVSLTPPEMDADSGERAMLQIVLAVPA